MAKVFYIKATVKNVLGEERGLHLDLSSFGANLLVGVADLEYPLNALGLITGEENIGFTEVNLEGLVDRALPDKEDRLWLIFDNTEDLTAAIPDIIEEILTELRSSDPCTIVIEFEGCDECCEYEWNGEELVDHHDVETEVRDILIGLKEETLNELTDLVEDVRGYLEEKGVITFAEGAIEFGKIATKTIADGAVKGAIGAAKGTAAVAGFLSGMFGAVSKGLKDLTSEKPAPEDPPTDPKS